jgi:hypothetical protein
MIEYNSVMEQALFNSNQIRKDIPVFFSISILCECSSSVSKKKENITELFDF